MQGGARYKATLRVKGGVTSTRHEGRHVENIEAIFDQMATLLESKPELAEKFLAKLSPAKVQHLREKAATIQATKRAEGMELTAALIPPTAEEFAQVCAAYFGGYGRVYVTVAPEADLPDKPKSGQSEIVKVKGGLAILWECHAGRPNAGGNTAKDATPAS